MNWRQHLSQNRSWLLPLFAAALLLVLGLVLIVMSTTGRALFGFADDTPGVLAVEQNIGAWITFDRPSYLIGDTARYRIRIVWRNNIARPDLETFETSIGFFPFDHRDSIVTRRWLGGSLREYVVEYILQAVNVDTAATYSLDTATVYYTLASEGHTDVHAFRANPPPVHVGDIYPQDIATVALQPLKPVIDDARALRRYSMLICGFALTGILLLLLWQRGRKRAYAKLSAAERLWRDFDELRREPANTRKRVVDFERVFTRALELRADVTPLQFWSGKINVDHEWSEVLAEAHRSFAVAYRPTGPSTEEVEHIAATVDEFLTPMVEQERLQREVHGDFVERLRRQPAVLAASAALAVAAIVAFTLAALPSAWLSTEFKRYNAAVAELEHNGDLQQAVDAFSELSDASEDLRVRAASSYNVGTLLADPRLMRLSREQHRNFMRVIFSPDITLELLLHDLELDAEFELITLLTEITRQYVQAEQALKAAVRAAPDDADAARNLEITGKLRKAISQSLARLIEQGEESATSEQMLGQTIIDLRVLMEAELPDDYAKLDEGKDDRDYFILERF